MLLIFNYAVYAAWITQEGLLWHHSTLPESLRRGYYETTIRRPLPTTSGGTLLTNILSQSCPKTSNMEGIVSWIGTIVPTPSFSFIHVPDTRPSSWNTINAYELLRLTRERHVALQLSVAFTVDGPLKDMEDLWILRSDCECKEFRVDGEFHKLLQAVTLETIEILDIMISVLEIYLLLPSFFRFPFSTASSVRYSGHYFNCRRQRLHKRWVTQLFFSYR